MSGPSILPPSSTALERALEEVAAVLLDFPAPVRAAWSPRDCPIDLLPWLAWGLSLDTWSSDWPEAIKRERVRRAIPIARQKGTVASVRSVVESFGGSVAMREWWQMDPPGDPHTFSLAINLDRDGVPSSAAFVDQVIAEVIRAKPVRSHFDFTQGLNVAGSVGMIAVARPVIHARLTMSAPASPAP